MEECMEAVDNKVVAKPRPKVVSSIFCSAQLKIPNKTFIECVKEFKVPSSKIYLVKGKEVVFLLEKVFLNTNWDLFLEKLSGKPFNTLKDLPTNYQQYSDLAKLLVRKWGQKWMLAHEDYIISRLMYAHSFCYDAFKSSLSTFNFCTFRLIKHELIAKSFKRQKDFDIAVKSKYWIPNPDKVDDPAEILLRKESKNIVDKILKDPVITEQQSKFLYMRFIEELKYKDIAIEANCQLQYVQASVEAALTKLRIKYGKPTSKYFIASF